MIFDHDRSPWMTFLKDTQIKDIHHATLEVLQRTGVGVEIEKKYCVLARDRVNKIPNLDAL